MKRFFLLLMASFMMLFGGCMQFDDTRIWDAIDELEDLYDELDGRLEDLEEACEKMNTNIEALQTLVSVLQAQDTITTIAPIKQGDEIIGYTISFSKSEPITIYHGEDGKDGADGEDGKDGANGSDGYTPTIGVAKDADENYYWTLDGEWLLDAEGNKIKANGNEGKDGADGEDGEDGITPKLEIRDGYWYISYDNGQSWVELGKATGEDGKDGANGADGADGEDGKDGENGKDGADGDSLFESVTWDDEYAYFTLSDGTVIKIPLALDSEAEEGDLPPANEIWYTSTDGEVVTPPDEFGVNIISNTYEDGKGVITFDGDVTSIGDYAFYDCSSLASVTIPESVTSIGDFAFAVCSSLASVSIGNGVTSIGIVAFAYCSSLAEFNGKFASSDGRCLIIDGVLNSFAPAGLTEYTIPDSVTWIGDNAFYNCSSLASVTIPDSVTSIGGSAFWNCTSLTSVTIPDSVTSIGWHTFYDCTSLKSVYCKATTPPAGDSDMFGRNASERKIYVPTESVDAYKTAEYWSKYADAFVPYDFEKGEVDMKYRKICYTSTDGNAVTPYATNVFGANIVSNTYEDGKGVIVFDSVVTSIGEDAFYDCSSLASITIPDSVTSIGDHAFAACKSLASVTIPESVTSIGEGAFYGCKSLTSITIPDGVTSIGEVAFQWCSSLASVTIPDSVTSIGDGAFSGCSSLASVSIGNGVTSIGYEAFGGCSSLASVTIPDSVTSIRDWAFSYCSSLTSVYCKATTPPSGGSNMFDYYNNEYVFVPIGCTIYVPTESVDAYKAADYWSEYADYIEPYNFGGGEGNVGVKEVAAVSLFGFYRVMSNFYEIGGYVSSGEDAGYDLPMNSWNYGFNIISDTEPVNDEIPLGTYTYVDYEKLVSGEEELKAGIFIIGPDWGLWCAYVDANGEMQEYKYTEGTIVVSEGKIELTVTLENGEVHHVIYEGSLQTWGEAA